MFHAFVDILRSVPAVSSGAFWDDRNQSTILRRFALGTALAHAVPIQKQFHDAPSSNDSYVEPVARYLHYEKAYLAGELDPAFEVLPFYSDVALACSCGSNEDCQSDCY